MACYSVSIGNERDIYTSHTIMSTPVEFGLLLVLHPDPGPARVKLLVPRLYSSESDSTGQDRYSESRATVPDNDLPARGDRPSEAHP